MTLALGGPGLACSAMRLRRLAAGELLGEERARAEEHLAGCARCQATAREIEAERRDLAESLPFQEFAAGVAERLARPAQGPLVLRALPLALAAGLAVAAATPLLLRLTRPEDGTRPKGGASAVLFAQEGAAVRALAPGDPIPEGARLRLSLVPAGRRNAAVYVVDADGAALLYAGPALAGPLPDAFEWTGGGPGTLLVLLSDGPLDAVALAARLGREGARAEPPPGAEAVRLPLRRGRR